MKFGNHTNDNSNNNWHHYSKKKKKKKYFFAGSIQEKPFGVINISGATLTYDYKKRKHVFVLNTPSEARFLLQAKSEEDMKDWVRKIERSNQSNSKGA